MAVELLRALGNGLLLPLHALYHFFRQRTLLEESRDDLGSSPELVPDQLQLQLPGRPLRIFLSCAEASGETHACNLVWALQQALRELGAPAPRIVGLGGPRLAALDVRVLGDPVSEARMGFSGIVSALPFYLRLVTAAAEEFSGEPVDLFIGVDSPALNVPLSHMASRCGARTVQYITPQYWGWAPWRVAGFRRAVDLGLSILPFEPAWFARHRVPVAHVGHPLLDELGTRTPQLATPNDKAPILALLPGSRRSVIERNLPMMLQVIAPRLLADPSWRVVLCQSDTNHRELIEACLMSSQVDVSRVEFSTDLEATLGQAEAALSVSGTILLHLLEHRLPTVVIYVLETPLQVWLGRHFLTVPWFSSVNLLAGREVYPEFSFSGGQPPGALELAVGELLGDPNWRGQCRAQLEFARERLGPPGASRRAALAALGTLAPTRTTAPTPL